MCAYDLEIDIGKLMSWWIIDSMTNLTDDDIDHLVTL